VTKSVDLAQALLGALREVPGLRPAQPATVPATLPWDAGLLAVDVDGDLVTMRLIASELPLPPLLERAGTALRSVLAAHGHQGVRLRLEITDLDQAAFGRPQAAIRPRRARRAGGGNEART
jgi:hypothetical protein